MPVPTTEIPTDMEQSMLGRTRLILYAFSGGAPELTLSELVRKTGLPRSSLHRILCQLVELQALDRTESGYRLGLSVIELGWLAAHQNRLRHCAMPHLRTLHEQTGVMVHLAVLDGHEIVYMDKLGNADETRVPSRLGGRRAAYCTGAGKALLAHAPGETMDRVLAAGTPARTPNTITNSRLLHQEFARIRERGVAFDREECFRGVFCIAAPLRDPEGRAVAAVSLTGTPRRMASRQLIPALLSTVGRVSGALFLPPRQERPNRETPTVPPPRDATTSSSPDTSSPSWPAGVLDGAVSWQSRNDWM